MDKSGMPRDVKGPYMVAGHPIHGKPLDQQTRCEHYHSVLDIIAIKLKCCHRYYPCYTCHEENADHQPEVWKKEEYDTKAVLCGSCGYEMTIQEYMSSQSRCPHCHAAFNPNCHKHHPLYFEV